MPSVSLLMGILFSRHPILNNRGRLPYLWRRDALIISKTQRLLYCLLCYGIFSKNETFLIVPSGKQKADAKVTTLRRIFQTLRELFFQNLPPVRGTNRFIAESGCKSSGFSRNGKTYTRLFLPKNESFLFHGWNTAGYG